MARDSLVVWCGSDGWENLFGLVPVGGWEGHKCRNRGRQECLVYVHRYDGNICPGIECETGNLASYLGVLLFQGECCCVYL